MEQTLLLRLSPQDNVFVLTQSLPAGATITIGGKELRLSQSLGLGHKIAAQDIAAGTQIVKYGAPIGSATRDIKPGEHVHLHNTQSDYLPTYTLDEEHSYVRRD